MKNKRLIPMLLTLSLISSCGSVKKDVSLFIYASDDTFISSLSGKIESDLFLEDISYKSYYGNRSQMVQNDQIISEIDNSTSKVLVINLVDRLSATSIIKKAKKKNLPIIFYNREPLSGDLGEDNVYYVGSDPKAEGQMQANLAEELFGSPANLSSYDKNGDGKIQLVMLKGEQGHQDMENRTQSFIKAMTDYGYSIELLTSSYCDWERTKGYSAMKSIYDEYYSKIELLVSNNDDMALGAIDYLKERGNFKENVANENQPFPIIGVDATKQGLDFIKKGLMYGTVQNDSYNQAKAISLLANCFLSGKGVTDEYPYTITSGNRIYTNGTIINAVNVDSLSPS